MNSLSLFRICVLAMVTALAACSSRTPAPSPSGPPTATVDSSIPITPAPVGPAVMPPSGASGVSRWIPVAWSELPGWPQDALHEAWDAWMRSCERPPQNLQVFCPQIRQLSIASEEERRAFLLERFQPYRVEAVNGRAEGLLTSYYEPLLNASRVQTPVYGVPLYAAPAGLSSSWYTRQQIDTLPAAQAALQGRELAWLSNPVDALVLHIQGSGRLRITEKDGTVRTVRMAFAGTNGQPYRSVGRWLLDQNLIRDASWPGIKTWTDQNPGRVQEMLWTNPRYVFFKEEALPESEWERGPKGAQGVPLTPGRSIAVDRRSIPYGTPVWMATNGPTVHLRRLVMAQDTGSAIVGAVRADYFAGWGEEAGELAGRIKQGLRLWALWPKGEMPQ